MAPAENTTPIIYCPLGLGSCGINHIFLTTAVHTAATLDPQTPRADPADHSVRMWLWCVPSIVVELCSALGPWVPGWRALWGPAPGYRYHEQGDTRPLKLLEATWTSGEDSQEKKGSPGALAHCGAAVGLATLRVPRSVFVFCESRRLSSTVSAGLLQLLSSRHLPDSGQNTCMCCGHTHVHTHGPALCVSGRLHFVLGKCLKLADGATNCDRSNRWSPQPGSHPAVGASGEFALLTKCHRAAVMT